MAVNKDFEDLLHSLNAVHARYLIVGAYAVIFYTEPRYTKDIDIWIEPSAENALKVHQALKRFGAPVKNLRIQDLTNPKLVYQIGVAPNRIDILMGIRGLSFDRAWRNRRVSRYGKETAHLLSREDLLRAKKDANRPQDRLDLERLLESAGRKRGLKRRA
jgi:hypothetical protein